MRKLGALRPSSYISDQREAEDKIEKLEQRVHRQSKTIWHLKEQLQKALNKPRPEKEATYEYLLSDRDFALITEKETVCDI